MHTRGETASSAGNARQLRMVGEVLQMIGESGHLFLDNRLARDVLKAEESKRRTNST